MQLSQRVEREALSFQVLLNRVLAYARRPGTLPANELAEVFVRVRDARLALEEDVGPALRATGIK
jgi:hypothetical protein